MTTFKCMHIISDALKICGQTRWKSFQKEIRKHVLESQSDVEMYSSIAHQESKVLIVVLI